jgi:hypothetical protein
VNFYRVLVFLSGEMQPASVMVIDAERYDVVAVNPVTDSTSWLRFYGEKNVVVAEFNGDRVAVVERITADEAQAIRFDAAEYRERERNRQ